jgi:hypothetical protein
VSGGSGTEVTARDIDSGEQQTRVIKDDYNLVTDGDCVVANVMTYPKSRTHVITIKNVGGTR